MSGHDRCATDEGGLFDVQALTAAFSPTGMHALIQWMLGDSMAKVLASQLQPPDTTVPLPDIFWTPPGSSTAYQYENITIRLTGGSFSGFAPQYQTLTQGDDGQFTISLVASGVTVGYSWNEQYDTILGFANMGHTNKTWPYSMGIDSFAFTVPFTISQQAGSYTLTVGTITATPSGLHPNIPVNSVVNHQEGLPCVPPTLDSATLKAIEAIDFSTATKGLLQDLFGTIPASGQLTPDIVFSFAEGDDKLTFGPNDSGIQVGATGTTTWNGQPFPGNEKPPSLQLPSIPTTAHAHLFAADYMFNELYWAFQKDGRLDMTLTKGTPGLPDPGILDTDYYERTSLKPLWQKYPGTPMTIGLAAAAAPTVTFQTVWDLTYGDDGVLTTQEAPLPDSVYAELQTLQGAVYLTEADYTAALTTALGPDYPTYGAQIVAASVVSKQFGQPYKVTAGGLGTLKSTVPVGIYQELTTAFVPGQGYVSAAWLQVAVASALGSDAPTYASDIEKAFAVSGGVDQVWWVTPGTNGALTSLVDTLQAPDVYNAILGLQDTVYLQLSDFQTDLENAIGAGAATYLPQIVKAAQVNGAVVTHDIQAVVNVLKGGQTVPCFTFTITETDFQQDFRLSNSGYNQTVQFDFQLIDGETGATLDHTNIPGITAENFATIWNFMLQPAYAVLMAKMGHTGVPLPFMTGMQFLFQQATVVVQPGYADVTADITYTTTAAAVPLSEPDHRNDHRGGHDRGHGHRVAEAHGSRTLRRGRAAAGRTRIVRGDAR